MGLHCIVDRAMQLRHLEQAERHIADGVRHISKQERLIAKLERGGHDATEAWRLLENFIPYRRRILHTGIRS